MKPCAICKAPRACWGYRYPGPRSAIPEGRKGYLWACTNCRPSAEARWLAATQPDQGRIAGE